MSRRQRLRGRPTNFVGASDWRSAKRNDEALGEPGPDPGDATAALPRKAHPPTEMHDVRPCLDDEVQRFHHPRDDGQAAVFLADPEAADAAADLAGELGSRFLSAATLGEDDDEPDEEASSEVDLEDLPAPFDPDDGPQQR